MQNTSILINPKMKKYAFDLKGSKDKRSTKFNLMKLDKNYQLVQDKNGNFAHKVGNRDDHFVLFCDPENMIYYRKYLNIDSFIRLEKIDDPELLK